MIKFAKLFTLILLVQPAFGLGQQDSSSRFAALISDAERSQSSGDYASAATSYRAALKIQPEIPELWANLGLMQQESEDFKNAVQSFQHALRLKPSLYVPNLFLGIDYVRMGRAQEALPVLFKAQAVNSDDPQVGLALGRAYIALGRFRESIEALKKTVDQDPKLASGWFALGIAYLDSVEMSAREVTVTPDSAFAQALYAESLEEQFRFREASDIFAKIVDSGSQPPCMRSELGYALLRRHDSADAVSAFIQENNSHPECSLALLGRARIALESAEAKNAIALLTVLWERDHGFLASNIHLLTDGLTEAQLSGFVASLREMQESADPEFYRTLIQSSTEPANDLDRQPQGPRDSLHAATEASSVKSEYAAGHFDSCAQGAPTPFTEEAAEIRQTAIACAFFTGDYRSASAAASTLLRQLPHSSLALYWMIKADERLAFQCLARFQRLEPNSARSHVLLGDIYRQRERYDDAIGEYQHALAIAPHDPASLLGLASAELNNNDAVDAAKVASAALALAPDDPEINLVMAEALIDKQEYAQAEPFLMKSKNVKQQMLPHVHALLGRAYAGTGNVSGAIAELKMGESSDVDGSVHYQLARLYRQRGDDADAETELQKTQKIKQQRHDQKLIAVDDPDEPIPPKS